MLGDATIYTTIAVRNLEAAKGFYGGKLGLTQIHENQGGVMYASGAGKIFVYQSGTAGTNQATYAAWQVDDIARTVSDLKAADITFEQYDIPGAAVEGAVYTMEGQKAAWFKDPDGNILSITG